MKLYTSPNKMELLIVIYQGEGNKNPPQANRQISENEYDLDNFICLEPDMPSIKPTCLPPISVSFRAAGRMVFVEKPP